MTAVPQDALPPEGGWTTDDLDALPEDGRRRELLDGVLLVSPSPTSPHQIISGRLMVALEEHCPDGYVVTQGVEIRVSRVRSFIPDVLVVDATTADRGPSCFAPHEVALAVEVVSPSSQAMDRITKPALYAKAGIPAYWRVETEDTGLVVHTYRLVPPDEVYSPTGRWTEVVDVDRPFPVKLPVDRFTPGRR